MVLGDAQRKIDQSPDTQCKSSDPSSGKENLFWRCSPTDLLADIPDPVQNGDVVQTLTFPPQSAGKADDYLCSKCRSSKIHEHVDVLRKLREKALRYTAQLDEIRVATKKREQELMVTMERLAVEEKNLHDQLEHFDKLSFKMNIRRNKLRQDQIELQHDENLIVEKLQTLKEKEIYINCQMLKYQSQECALRRKRQELHKEKLRLEKLAYMIFKTDLATMTFSEFHLRISEIQKQMEQKYRQMQILDLSTAADYVQRGNCQMQEPTSRSSTARSCLRNKGRNRSAKAPKSLNRKQRLRKVSKFKLNSNESITFSRPTSRQRCLDNESAMESRSNDVVYNGESSTPSQFNGIQHPSSQGCTVDGFDENVDNDLIEFPVSEAVFRNMNIEQVSTNISSATSWPGDQAFIRSTSMYYDTNRKNAPLESIFHRKEENSGNNGSAHSVCDGSYLNPALSQPLTPTSEIHEVEEANPVSESIESAKASISNSGPQNFFTPGRSRSGCCAGSPSQPPSEVGIKPRPSNSAPDLFCSIQSDDFFQEQEKKRADNNSNSNHYSAPGPNLQEKLQNGSTNSKRRLRESQAYTARGPRRIPSHLKFGNFGTIKRRNRQSTLNKYTAKVHNRGQGGARSVEQVCGGQCIGTDGGNCQESQSSGSKGLVPRGSEHGGSENGVNAVEETNLGLVDKNSNSSLAKDIVARKILGIHTFPNCESKPTGSSATVKLSHTRAFRI